MSGSRLIDSLTELTYAERNLRKAYRKVKVLSIAGGLNMQTRAEYEQLRVNVMVIQDVLYVKIQSVLSPLGFGDQVSRPTPPPTLRASPSSVATVGLGALPAIPWAAAAAAVIIYLATIAAVTWLAWRVVEIGADFMRSLVATRANTSRYVRQVSAQQERFTACLQQTQDPAFCGDQFRTPDPTYEQTALQMRDDPAMRVVTIGSITVGIGVLGYVGWQVYRGQAVGSMAKRLTSR